MPASDPDRRRLRLPADAVLLDVREDDEWSAGHIDGARHVPMYQVPQHVNYAEDLSPDVPIVVVCKMGGRSAQVTAWLNQQGYDAVEPRRRHARLGDGRSSDGQRGRPAATRRLSDRAAVTSARRHLTHDAARTMNRVRPRRRDATRVPPPAPDRPLVVAHRGASSTVAEHTLGAYVSAIEAGAEGLECDVRLTRDGHLVCVHDRTVNRTSDGTGVVSELDLRRARGARLHVLARPTCPARPTS